MKNTNKLCKNGSRRSFARYGKISDAVYISRPITFIVDTGCPFSFVGAVDSEKLNIKIAGKRPIEYVAWGDKMIKLFPLHGSELYVRAEDEGIEKLYVLRHKKLKATLDFVETRGKKDSPNVLGMDFITENGLKLVVEGRSKTAYFEM